MQGVTGLAVQCHGHLARDSLGLTAQGQESMSWASCLLLEKECDGPAKPRSLWCLNGAKASQKGSWSGLWSVVCMPAKKSITPGQTARRGSLQTTSKWGVSPRCPSYLKILHGIPLWAQLCFVLEAEHSQAGAIIVSPGFQHDVADRGTHAGAANDRAAWLQLASGAGSFMFLLLCVENGDKNIHLLGLKEAL